MKMSDDIRALVEQTPFVDTHEHLWEESLRVKALELKEESKTPAPDIGVFFSHYSDSDLHVAGMPGEAFSVVHRWDIAPEDKWKAIEPFYLRARNTGYMMNVRESLRMLYGEEDLTLDNVDRVSEKLRAAIRPGYYKTVLREVSNIEYTQVNSLEGHIFMETAQPDLLSQDLSFAALSAAGDREKLAEAAGVTLKSLKDWHAVIDWAFASYGPRAIAVKSQNAYGRGLNYDRVSEEDAAPRFEKMLARPDKLAPEERKAIEDHLFHYCVNKATEYELPVKLHTGYYAGHNSMPLARLQGNPGEMCELCRAHPNTRFVFMHITYPYHDHAIAVAKQWSNAYIDMCWAWIINPVACVRFVKEFLGAAPACKLLTFGGDYLPVEMVPGHAALARRGLSQAITELVDEGWVNENTVQPLVERLMNGNAHKLFNLERTLKNWRNT